MGKYSAEDADITLQLSAILKKQVKESGMEELFRTVELLSLIHISEARE